LDVPSIRCHPQKCSRNEEEQNRDGDYSLTLNRHCHALAEALPTRTLPFPRQYTHEQTFVTGFADRAHVERVHVLKLGLVRTRRIAQIVLSGQRINNIIKTLAIEMCVEYEWFRLVPAHLVMLHNVVLEQPIFEKVIASGIEFDFILHTRNYS
jgi:hypothetical protein